MDSYNTMTTARDARSVSSDSGDHNSSVQESDACPTEACVFRVSVFGAFEARLNSDTTHTTDIEAEAMQTGFKPEEVKMRVGEVLQTFRQRSLRNETKKKWN